LPPACGLCRHQCRERVQLEQERDTDAVGVALTCRSLASQRRDQRRAIAELATATTPRYAMKMLLGDHPRVAARVSGHLNGTRARNAARALARR